MSDSSRFCDVALPVPLDQAFTYSIPSGMQVQPGMRIVAPFGARKLVGVVLCCGAAASHLDSAAIKPLLRTLEDRPSVSAEFLRLSRWIATYYLVPQGEVLAAMLPLEDFVQRSARWVLTELGQQALARADALTAAERRLLERIAKRGGLRRESLRDATVRVAAAKAAAPTAALVARARRKGWIRLEVGIQPSVKAASELQDRPAGFSAVGSRASKGTPSGVPEVPESRAALAAEVAFQKRDTRPSGAKAPVSRPLSGMAEAMPLQHSEGIPLQHSEEVSQQVSGQTQPPYLTPAETLRQSAGSSEPVAAGSRLALTGEQSQALERIGKQMESGEFGVLLLHGVTGSGKTEVYMRAIELSLSRGRPALLLVPEISLTPAAAGLFLERFGSRVAILHSGLASRERAEQWRRVREGAADVVLGTRSAVFAPLPSPGLVIVDEEHDSSYKQEEAPRYNARDVAVIRGQQAKAAVILGSATPSMESRYHAQTGKYQLLELESRVLERPLAQAEIVDMRQEFAETGRRGFLSRRLLEALQQRLREKQQSLILLNRRGYSAFLLCRKCGKTVECANCSIALTHHRRMARLMCHYCGAARPVPRFCPQCASEHLQFVGEGSERVEEALHQHFPEARIGRLDRDTARGRGSAEAILAAFQHYELDILTGTQMIAKGHDIHRVTFVGVISADIGLARPDFRAAERAFQLLTQVAGRAGRGEFAGEVVIQTYFPEHYAIRAAAAQDYTQFYRQELRFRELMHYPPFAALANIIVRSASAETALKLTTRLGRHLTALETGGVRVLGPAAAPVFRLKRIYRYHFLIKAAGRSLLRTVLASCREFAARQKFPATSLVLDVDPQLLL